MNLERHLLRVSGREGVRYRLLHPQKPLAAGVWHGGGEPHPDWVRERGGIAVTAEAARENRGSCALLEKCGFTVLREASFRKYH